MKFIAEPVTSIEQSVGTLRGKVLRFLKARGRHGATDHEMQSGIPMDPSTQRPRRIELVHKGLVQNSGRSRPTPSGRQAIVWITVDEFV